MNKLNYSKPQFMPILLEETTAKNCVFTVNYCENVCAVDVGGGTVFNTKPPCTYWDSPGAKEDLCFTVAGVNENVYGS